MRGGDGREWRREGGREGSKRAVWSGPINRPVYARKGSGREEGSERGEGRGGEGSGGGGVRRGEGRGGEGRGGEEKGGEGSEKERGGEGSCMVQSVSRLERYGR